VIVATAAHVIRGAVSGGRVRLIFYGSPGDSIDAVLEQADAELDLAVLSLPQDRVPIQSFAFDREGDPWTLKTGDPVVPVGCPDGVCWEPPISPDRLIGVHERGIAFESFFISPGSSGGALFNHNWEVIGLVVEKADPQGRALSFQQVSQRVRAWGYPVQMSERRIPRSGYRTQVSLLALASPSEPAVESGRWPSGRAAVLFNGQRRLGWHVSGLRLAPEDLTISAGLVGVDLRFRIGPLGLSPFAEIGLGRVEGRFDAGGYYVQSANGPVFKPYWNQVRSDVIGIGGGASMGLMLFPHLAVEGLIGHWSFRTPSEVRSAPDVFMGAGVRFGF
jgi:hypothetical protein